MVQRVEYDTGQPRHGDWRVQEMLNMEPQLVMEELLTLAEAVMDAKVEYNEASAELSQAQAQLALLEAQVVQEVWDSEDTSRLDGKNAEIRGRKEAIFLARHQAVQSLREEVALCEKEEAEKRAAYEALVDRQKNLHAWARMFSATMSLLATVKVETDWQAVAQREVEQHGAVTPEEAREMNEPHKDAIAGAVDKYAEVSL